MWILLSLLYRLGNWFLWSKSDSDSTCKCKVNFPIICLAIQIWLSIDFVMLKCRIKYGIIQNKGKYSLLDTSCLRFWILITKILVSHIHKNTVVTDEHVVSLRRRMQFPPKRWPVVVLQMAWRTISWMDQNHAECCVPVCGQKNYAILFWGFVWLKNKMFSRNHIQHFICVVSHFKDDF